jgi:hypothetical protein
MFFLSWCASLLLRIEVAAFDLSGNMLFITQTNSRITTGMQLNPMRCALDSFTACVAGVFLLPYLRQTSQKPATAKARIDPSVSGREPALVRPRTDLKPNPPSRFAIALDITKLAGKRESDTGCLLRPNQRFAAASFSISLLASPRGAATGATCRAPGAGLVYSGALDARTGLEATGRQRGARLVPGFRSS